MTRNERKRHRRDIMIRSAFVLALWLALAALLLSSR